MKTQTILQNSSKLSLPQPTNVLICGFLPPWQGFKLDFAGMVIGGIGGIGKFLLSTQKQLHFPPKYILTPYKTPGEVFEKLAKHTREVGGKKLFLSA
jgi:hypothetical protein